MSVVLELCAMGYEKTAHLYDLFDTKDNISFFLSYGRDAGTILDIGAGTGRIAIPLAGKGVKVYCVEPSPAMRREFAARLDRRPAPKDNIALIEDDVWSFNLKRTFPAAFMSGCFDHFLDDSERLSALENIRRHLIPGGILVFDIFLGLMEESGRKPAGSVIAGPLEYRRYVATKRSSAGIMTVTLVFETYEKGVLVDRIEEQSRVGVIDRLRIHQLLTETGFEIRCEFGNYDRGEYKAGDALLIIEAEKK